MPIHQFCWIDLMARDAEATREFLSKLFGWEVEQQDTQGGPPYFIFRLHGKQVCGFGQMNQQMVDAGTPSIWCSYVEVEDVERSIEKATGLGAEVMMPAMDVMSAGRMAVLGDPEGAMFALWQAKDHCGAQIANVPNTWSWNELVSRDLPQACKFYSDMFGWEISKDEASEIEYWNICNQGRLNGGMTAMQPGTPDAIPAYWSVYFSVADIKQSVEQLQQLGGKLLHGPFTVEPGHIAIVSEPGDGVFSLIEMTTPPDEFP